MSKDKQLGEKIFAVLAEETKAGDFTLREVYMALIEVAASIMWVAEEAGDAILDDRPVLN